MRALAVALAVVASAAVCIVAARSSGGTRLPAFDGTVHARQVPDLALIDDRGAPLRLNASPRGSFVVLGYTRCADECPLTLARVAVARRSVEPRARPDAFLVTVDPAHDDPATMHRYLAAWHGAIVGVTGAPSALKRLSVALGAGDAQRQPREHDTRVFLVAQGGDVRAELSPDVTPAAIADAARSLAATN